MSCGPLFSEELLVMSPWGLLEPPTGLGRGGPWSRSPLLRPPVPPGSPGPQDRSDPQGLSWPLAPWRPQYGSCIFQTYVSGVIGPLPWAMGRLRVSTLCSRPAWPPWASGETVDTRDFHPWSAGTPRVCSCQGGPQYLKIAVNVPRSNCSDRGDQGAGARWLVGLREGENVCISCVLFLCFRKIVGGQCECVCRRNGW